MKKLTKKKRRNIIAWTVVLELILAALVVYGVYSGALKNSLVEGTVIVMLLLNNGSIHAMSITSDRINACLIRLNCFI